MGWHQRLGNLFHRTELSQAIDDELQFHIDERVDELVEQGMSEAEARRLARRQFGNVTLHKETTRERDLFRNAEIFFQDVRYAVRSLRHARAFTAAALATLALGIGATTVIYSLVHTVWLRPLPFAAPDRVVRIWETNQPLGIRWFAASIPNLLSWRERSASFESLVAVTGRSANLEGRSDPERVASLAVTADFFDALGLRPLVGRAFAKGEDAPGGGRVVMLSERLWKRRYAGDPDLIGRTIAVNGERRTVVGIAPRDAGFREEIDLWEPLTLDASRENRGNHYAAVLGRLKPGVTVGQANAELNRVAAQLEREFPISNRNWRVRVAPAIEGVVEDSTRSALVVLMAAVGLLLIVASINVANLVLARASARVQEFGVRLALGASRGRLVRQLVTESLVLAAAGGACGLFVAWLGVHGLGAILPADVPRAADLSLDLPVLAVAAGLTLLTGLLFGLAPAWAASRANIHSRIQQGRRTAGSGMRLRRVLVAGEFALATVLIAGAGLLLVSFQHLLAVRLGFQSQSVLTARLSLPGVKYPQPRAQAFYRDLERELGTVPGLEAAGVANNVPFGGGDSSMTVTPVEKVEGVPPIQASWRAASAGYFHALGIPLLRGRFFDERDKPPVLSVLLGDGLARRLWPDGRNPIGRLVRLGEGDPFTVVGVVGAVRQLTLQNDPKPAVYLPTSLYVADTMLVVMRAPGDPARLAPALRRVVSRLDPQQPIFGVQTLGSLIDATAARPRLNTLLVGSFALLALALGVVGVAGVVAYTVVRRTPEMAVRMALGATPRQVVHTVTADGLRICLLGLAAGLAGAYALGRVMAGLLYQVRPDDPAILCGVAAVLLAAALAASWLPARRIGRIDPVASLRQE